ncbi:3-hydroxyacyl-CoA dehydrogenase [Gemmobacter serpentinus]|uniref:3-hydroxyacyl-CoA dehydrogenase n=1 Tax=Gemmobacter serpentinus TaxID=2652247 RepID=UPI00124E714C|nr:3-hydroxyacyl-CoA dehydrogenase NAD-binding domain-containing protein [Gemmobacter serpentinus]
MTTIAVIGLGTMGLGIVQTWAAAGFDVLATDTHEPARATAQARLLAALTPRVEAGKMGPSDRDAILARVRIVADLSMLQGADLAVEAVVERLEVKQALFAKLEQHLGPGAILATNTSSLSVTAIAGGLRHPERLLGLHFFNPAPVMKLVELVSHPAASTDALTRARAITEAAGKTVIQCPDRPGFIVNRCARPFYGEALAMVEEVRSPLDIDAAMMAAGYRLGPFALIDLVGADINLAATESLFAAMDRHPRYHVFDALRAQVAKGDLGRKSGTGFVFPQKPGAPPADADAIVLRIEAALINEAAWLLSEGGTTREWIDTALKLGLNFPRGPFEMQARHGAAIETELARLEARAPAHLTSRYLPPTG